MADPATMTQEEREATLGGIGCARKRKEDARFVQGKGNYVDDLKLPGMLFGDFVRSQYGHARIKSIDTSKAKALPGVRAVLTAEDLKPLEPALHADARGRRAGGARRREGAVPEPGDRVRGRRRPLRRGRRGRADRGRVRGAAGAERSRSRAGRRRAGAARGPRGQDRRARTGRAGITTTSSPGRSATRRRPSGRSPQAEVSVKEKIVYQRVHPCPLETCACVASMDKINGELTVWGTFQAPHVVRTVASLLSGIPEAKIHIIAPDIGGGFGNKVGVYPGYVCAIVASIVLGVPVKWVEDRIENLSATAFARDYHMTGELAATRDGRITGLRVPRAGRPRRVRRLRRSDQVSRPASSRSCTGSYDIPTAHVVVDGVYTNKAPGGVAYRCSFRVTEASYLIERIVDVLAHKLGDRPGRAAAQELHPAGAVPLSVGARLGVRLRRLSDRACDKAHGRRRLRGPAPGAGGEAGAFARGERADGHRRRVLHRDRRRRADPQLRHPGRRHVRFLRDPGPSHRQRDRAARHQEPGPGRTRPPTPRSWRPRSASRPS